MASAPGAIQPLRNREFRLLFAATAISLTGDGIWLVAIAFQVIELGGGPVALSLVAGAYSVGLIGFVLVGGIAADRLARRTVMLVSDLVRAGVVGVAGALAVTGSIELWQLGVAGFLIGSAEGFFLPSYTGLLPQAACRRANCSPPTGSRGCCGRWRSSPPARRSAGFSSPCSRPARRS